MVHPPGECHGAYQSRDDADPDPRLDELLEQHVTLISEAGEDYPDGHSD